MAIVKNKERVVKEIREKQRLSYKGTPIRQSADFAKETLQHIFKILKGKKKMPSRILYPEKLSFRIEGEIKKFSGRKKLKEYRNTKSIIKEMLTGFLYIEKKQEYIGKRKSQ